MIISPAVKKSVLSALLIIAGYYLIFYSLCVSQALGDGVLGYIAYMIMVYVGVMISFVAVHMIFKLMSNLPASNLWTQFLSWINTESKL
jgi:hypothetical protein